MIAQRFRALGWVAGISSAACALYLISLQVAAERAKLDDVNQRIAAAQRDMRALQTELGTRANMRQLQKWNDDVLSLSAPRAAQYLGGEHELATLEPGIVTTPAAPQPAQVMLVAATPTAPKPAVEAPVRLARAEVVPPADISTPIRRVSYDVAPARPARVATVERTMLDRGTIGDLVRTAAEERRKRP